MPIEWTIIFLGTIAASVYFSYRNGYDAGIEEGVRSTLQNLEKDGVIELIREEDE